MLVYTSLSETLDFYSNISVIKRYVCTYSNTFCVLTLTHLSLQQNCLCSLSMSGS